MSWEGRSVHAQTTRLRLRSGRAIRPLSGKLPNRNAGFGYKICGIALLIRQSSIGRRFSEEADLFSTLSHSPITLNFDLRRRAHRLLIFRRHERDQDPLGPGAPRQRRRARLPLGGDGMGRLAPGLPAPARPPLVRTARLAGLSAARLLLVVVRLRRLCARRSSSRAPTSPRPAGSPPSSSRSPCRSGARAKPSSVTTYGSARWAETREVRDAGLLRPRRRAARPLAATTICATTVPSMCCASRRPDPARASASSCRRC